MMDRSLLLDVQNLTTEFRTEEGVIRAVDNVSFHLNRGETLGIVGESGSGKSVTSLSIMQLIPDPPGRITSGSILFNGKGQKTRDLLKLNNSQMRKVRGNEISMIFQEPMTSLNPVYTCGQQVMEAIILHEKISPKEAKEKTLALFKKVLLPRPEIIFSSFPHQISGGQKQRVMIAMAMSCNPDILIADEPTTALDVTVQKTILKLMGELQQENDMGIIFITHDLGVIAELADRVVVMYKGKIVEQGPVLDIFSKPQHPYTKGLLACRPPLEKRYYSLPTIADFVEEDGTGETVTRIGQDNLEQFLKKREIIPEDRKKRIAKLYKQTPLLEVRNLSTHFPIKRNFFGSVTEVVKAVDDVNFVVYPGETLGLVGESGCGKTTLGRSILRLMEPTSGSILYKGEDITLISQREFRHFRKEIQIIFQDPYSSLNPRLAIGDAIMEPMQVHNILENNVQRKKKVIELLERVNMNESHFHRYPHEFSGGQRQRVCIARALALNPSFIICDESVSALDVSVQANVLNLLNELRDEFGFTYIFISHDLSVVKFMSDRMIVMNKGKIEEMGDADRIYENPVSPYTRKLIAAIPRGRLEDIVQSQSEKAIRRQNALPSLP